MSTRNLTAVCCMFVVVLLVSGQSSSEIPRKINYQAKITDFTTGEPMVGSHDLTFSIYDQPLGGTLLWSEAGTIVADETGIFSTILGVTNPIDMTFDGPCWLEISVGGEVLTPRRELVSVPYAFRAMDADSLGGMGPASYALAGHSHDDLYVNEGQANSITGAMIVDGQVADQDIAPGAAINPSKVAGTAWTSTNDGSGSGLDADMVDGQHAAAFAPTGHVHDDRYYTKTELNSSGTINQTSNPVDWTKLKGVPAGFADGTDNGAGDGYSLDAADGSPTDVVYVANDGNVGIGTTNPTMGKLQVLGVSGTTVYAGSNDGTAVLGSSTNGTGVLGTSSNGKAGSFVGDVYISGKLGIGTATPIQKLDVNGNISSASTYMIRDTTVLAAWQNRALLVGLGAGGGSSLETIGNTLAVGYDAGYLTYGQHNTFIGTRAGYMSGSLAIPALGNTFLGYQAGSGGNRGDRNTFLGSLAGQLHTTGEDNTFVGEGAGMGHVAGRYNTMIGDGAGYGNVTGSGNVFLGFLAGADETGSDKLYIANGSDPADVLIYGDFTTGRLGLGTSSPERKVHILGDGPRILIESNTGASPEVNFENTDDTSAQRWAVYKHGTADDLRFYQNGDRVTFQNGTGNVAIGTTDPAGYRLYVNGAAYATSGWQPSDLRLKTDLAGIDDALGKVARLSGKSFRWRTEEYADRGLPAGRHFGLVAQEVEEVLPEVVGPGPDGEKALAYSELIPVLVEAIKQLKAESEELRAASETLRGENEMLTQRISALEKVQGVR
jgi:hypothetical protein